MVVKLPAEPGSMGDTIRGIHRIDLVRRWSGREPIISTNIPKLLADHQTVPLSVTPRNAYELMAVLCDSNSAYFVQPGKGRVVDKTLAKAIATLDLIPYRTGINQLQWLQVVSSIEGTRTNRPSVNAVKEALDLRVDLRLKNKIVLSS